MEMLSNTTNMSIRINNAFKKKWIKYLKGWD